jgi:sigma-E factor negative regulatory protein RseC
MILRAFKNLLIFAANLFNNMSESKTISHLGNIESIEEEVIMIRIVSTAACSSCSAKGACSASEIEEKIIEVARDKSKDYKVGQVVNIQMEESLGTRAVVLGYLIPLIVMVTSIAILVNFVNEGMAAIIGVLSLIPYYLILYVTRQNQKNKFQFRIA